MNIHTVVHEPDNRRFIVKELGHVASLVYYELPDGSIDFAETWTPLEIRERGITTAIIKYALEWARREGHRIIPGCPFVATYVDRHNDYSDLLVTRSSKR